MSKHTLRANPNLHFVPMSKPTLRANVQTYTSCQYKPTLRASPNLHFVPISKHTLRANVQTYTSCQCPNLHFVPMSKQLDVFQWEIRFVYVSTLAWNNTNAVFRSKTRLFVRFTMENQLCLTVNSHFHLHKYDNPSRNTFFWVFFDGKSDLCKFQLWLEITQMRYSIAKHFFLCILQWNISFV